MERFARASDLIGSIAGTLTTISFIPQVVKVWRSRSAHDLSIGMFLAFSAGVACWLAYGIVKQDVPVIVANAVTFALSFSILAMKVAFARQKPR
jgi:MtN3 and saliva related transmembrane protein